MNAVLKPVNLEVIKSPYPETLLDKWRSGDYSTLTDSQASDYIKTILIHKLNNRYGRWFFGEAYIASTTEMADGWYSSYKWLTVNKWVTGKGLKSEFERSFYHALIKHIGLECIINLQSEAKKIFESNKDEFLIDGKYKKPVAPDLLIIDKEGRLNFIECKLPGDTIGKHQLAGLALIEKVVGAVKPVSMMVMELYPEKN